MRVEREEEGEDNDEEVDDDKEGEEENDDEEEEARCIVNKPHQESSQVGAVTGACREGTIIQQPEKLIAAKVFSREPSQGGKA